MINIYQIKPDRDIKDLSEILGYIINDHSVIKQCEIMPAMVKLSERVLTEGIDQSTLGQNQKQYHSTLMKMIKETKNEPRCYWASVEKGVIQNRLSLFNDILNEKYSCRINAEHMYKQGIPILRGTYNIGKIKDSNGNQVALIIVELMSDMNVFDATIVRLDKDIKIYGKKQFLTQDNHRREEVMKSLAEEVNEWLELKL